MGFTIAAMLVSLTVLADETKPMAQPKLGIKYGVEDPVPGEATLIIVHLQALRREVKEFREQKRP
jgi:hypothetical protein